MEFQNHILEETGVVIEAKELSIWTPEEKPWWRRKPTKPKTLILNNVTGHMKTGEFVAVIGPSGSGKTTFLVALAGRSTLPSKGSVTLNGTNVKELQRGVVEIVPQFDMFMENLTVMEHLVFMTEMQLGSVKKPANSTKLNALVTELKLKMHVDTRIQSLSGGERRLLSLTSSLLSSPQVLICDEPTTGLDSYNAALVVGVLKKLSLSGTIVICSVHQPSSDLFKEFNTITLMSEGKIVFYGSQDDCKELFESINLHCPKNYNPAEFYIRAVSDGTRGGNYIERIMENNLNRSYEANYTPIMPQCQRNWCKQVQLLLWRCSLSFKRSLKNCLIQLIFCTLISSLIMGTCYIGITGTTQRGVQDLRGFLWLVCSEVSFSLSYNALFTFEAEIGLFKREVGVYRTSAYYVSVFFSIIPRCIVWPVTYVIIVTLAVHLPNHLMTALDFVVILIAVAIASTAYGLGMAALFTSTRLMADVLPCADLPLFLMSGAFLRISSLPSWLYPVKYFSHFYYGMDAMSNIYWRQIDYIDCPSNSTSICYKDGASVLIETGYSTDFVFQDSLGLLFVTIVWSILGYLGLKREERKGYTY
ncbi:protein brown-like [Epargyreus clarus]|uniref:protein brown-like n=1 Tax=Epargyreus clarus TaxID=520877 RepID=UPI003C2BA001